MKKNKAFQKNHMKVVGQVVAASGSGASKDVESSCSGDDSYRKIKIEEGRWHAAVGKKNTTSLSLFMEAFGLDVEEDLSTVATQTWAEGTWL